MKRADRYTGLVIAASLFSLSASAHAMSDCDLLIRVCNELKTTNDLCSRSQAMVERYRTKGEEPSALSLQNERENCALFAKSVGHFKTMRRRVEDVDCLERALKMVEGISLQ